MYKTGNRTIITWVALVLALLILLPMPVLAAEPSVPSAEENTVLSPQETPAPEGTPSALESPVPEEQESSSVEEPSSEPQDETGEDPVASPTPQPENSAEESSALEENQAQTLASLPLLVVGGHKAYMSGEAGGIFRPDDSMTRAEAAAVLYNLLAAQDPVKSSHFSDVSSGAWYYKAVNVLTDKGVLSGYSDGTFRPGNAITRAEFVTAVSKCFEMKAGSATFPDTETHWAKDIIASAVGMGWVSGIQVDGQLLFQPDKPILRCQVAALMNQALQRTGDGFAADASKQEFVDVPTSHWAFKHIAEAADPVPGTSTDPGKIQVGSTVRVTAEPSLRVRSGPGTNYSQVGLLSTGTLITVTSVESNGWLGVKTSSGVAGYVSGDYVELVNGSTPTPSPTPDPDPSGFQVGQTVRVTADDGLRLRSGPGTSYSQIGLLSTGTLVTVTSVESNGWLGVKTSSGTTGYVSGDYVEVYTGGGGGTGSASGASLSASHLTLSQYQTIRLDGSVTSNIGAMRWTSSNSTVAYVGYTVDYGGNVQGAMVYGASPGTATITFTDADGTTSATCTVTVNGPEAVRFAYADENIVAVGSEFNLVAITDTSRSKVTFSIQSGPARGTYYADSYEEVSQVSSRGLPTNTVRVFSSKVHFEVSGLYTVRAYCQEGGSYKEFTVLVTGSNVSNTTATYDSRRTSSDMIWILANYEGLVNEIEDDQIAAGNPTVGYGYVVPKNTAFYNNMTQKEAYAQLVESVNSDGYATAVENFRTKYNIKMSQGQFDALVSFAYNLGPGKLSTSYSTFRALLNATDPSGISSSNPVTGTLNVSDAILYQDASTSKPVATVALTQSGGQYTTKVTVTGYRDYRNSRQQEVWYQVTTSDGKSGWMPAGYVQLSGNRSCDLSWADSTVLANNILQWCHSGSTTYAGLVYRRLSECKIFFFGNYAEGNPSSANYKVNTYGFLYPDDAKPYEH